jgi:predicted PurR-regulated permease PerM
MSGVERGTSVAVALIAAVLIFGALALAQAIVVPLAFALFTIAIVWPLQRALQRHLPNLVAVALTLVVTLVVVASVTGAVVWGFGRVAQWIFANVGRFQVLYGQASEWLEGHGFLLASVFAENFDVRWMLRLVQEVSGRLQGLTSFLIITLVYVLLGLLEVDAFKSQVARLKRQDIAAYLTDTGAHIAARFQKYMAVRTFMSIATGAVVWAFTLAAGMELATAWGAIAFALNYIPFIGPFVATFLPTMFALAQFESWQMALLVFACLNVIQFLSGSYLEPRIAGKAVAISPTVVLFAVFFWAFLWGLAGAFIGVPVMIAALTACAHSSSARWIADLLSGEPAPPPDGAAPVA